MLSNIAPRITSENWWICFGSCGSCLQIPRKLLEPCNRTPRPKSAAGVDSTRDVMRPPVFESHVVDGTCLPDASSQCVPMPRYGELRGSPMENNAVGLKRFMKIVGIEVGERSDDEGDGLADHDRFGPSPPTGARSGARATQRLSPSPPPQAISAVRLVENSSRTQHDYEDRDNSSNIADTMPAFSSDLYEEQPGRIRF